MCEISVIIPVYNGSEFIERCFNSLMAQKFSDFEAIFVDDGSKDNSFEILSSLEKKDKRIRVIKQENKKQGAARNTGVKNAKGKYIAYLDIDDFISGDFLFGLYEAIEENKCDVAAVSILRYKNEKKQRWLLKYDKKEVIEDAHEKLTITYGDGSGCGVWNKIFKKEFLFKNDIFFRENVFYEDSDYITKAVYLADKLAVSNVGAYYYCVNKNSTMRTKADKKKQYDKYIGSKITQLYLLDKKIITRTSPIQKFDVSFLGLNLIRIKEVIDKNYTVEKYYLFDLIKIFEIKKTTSV